MGREDKQRNPKINVFAALIARLDPAIHVHAKVNPQVKPGPEPGASPRGMSKRSIDLYWHPNHRSCLPRSSHSPTFGCQRVAR